MYSKIFTKAHHFLLFYGLVRYFFKFILPLLMYALWLIILQISLCSWSDKCLSLVFIIWHFNAPKFFDENAIK